MNVIVFALRVNDFGRCISRRRYASSVFVDTHNHADALCGKISAEGVARAGAEVFGRRRERLLEIDRVAGVHALSRRQIRFIFGVGRIGCDEALR